MNTKKRVVMDADKIERSIMRISYEILEDHKGVTDLIFIGIRSGGILLAKRLSERISRIEGKAIPTGILDINLYRDDVMMAGGKRKLGETHIPCCLDNKKVILVDDVIFTGRTIRAAMDALMDFGRPKIIRLAVLIDRGHRELPIRPDYVGENLPSSLWEEVNVTLTEAKAHEEVVVIEN
ncbi:MAG: bifunctional pyr operon transcriptional regulator/uracil phosphoribosyltransferase PyrR [Syntrophales bacterium]|jgi:pyrimidine operon attenuation protein/uracil phosphoribosyltransferase|nr:bifunctional pyr operon transcriptional regulator/uracil phosphoribosyltransferase PyrR [Syntrophales bacterium]MDY0043933.1 bifunctional pyr operon transcriptional regulator/uracil phosphoribosyltransferase PyrR [Syntrophales bacterium]